jgi:hypothetical protein
MVKKKKVKAVEQFIDMTKIISIKIFFLPVPNLDVSSVKMAVRTGIS